MQHDGSRAFTLGELLISVAVLALLVAFLGRVFSNATTLITTGNKRIDCDSQAQQLFDRFALDLSAMLRRSDVDYYIKSTLDPEKGNDHIAFFSQVEGYYPSTGSQSPISLVAYRINSDQNSSSFCKMERLGKGLLWNGVSTTNTPLVFGLQTIASRWPSAADSSTADPDYEVVAPSVFRFEYFYFLKDGSLSDLPGGQGLTDIAGFTVCIAVADPRSRLILTNNQLSTLAGNMADFATGDKPGDLLTQWRQAIDSTNNMPRAALSSIRLYQHTFHLLPKY